MDKSDKKLNIFISYSHKNMKYKEKILVPLEALKQSYNIEPWHDGMIDAGGDIDENVKKALKKADIILLLITDSYLSSYYCMKIELENAIKREKQGKCKVIPVMFQESVLDETLSFFKHNRVPEDGKPIATGFKNQSLGCTRAVNMIKRMIDKNFPGFKKGGSSSSTKASQKTPILKNVDNINKNSTLNIELYKNGKPANIPITQEFITIIPKYHNSINEFSEIMDQSLLTAKKRYAQISKKYKGVTIPSSDKLNQLRLFLMDVCAYTKTYITEPAGIKVHFRISKDRNYIGLIASTDDDDLTDLSSDWSIKMTPIPFYNGLIYHSSLLKAPLIKSLNTKLNFKCKNNDIWKDYLTVTFPSLHTGQEPLISYCISIHKDYYKAKANLLKVLAYLNFGRVIEKYVVDYCNICKSLDKTFSLNDVINSL